MAHVRMDLLAQYAGTIVGQGGAGDSGAFCLRDCHPSLQAILRTVSIRTLEKHTNMTRIRFTFVDCVEALALHVALS